LQNKAQITNLRQQGGTRESAAIYVADELLQDRAEIHVYDPKVSAERIYADLEYLQINRRENNSCSSSSFVSLEPKEIRQLVHIHTDPYTAMQQAHAIAVLTEWDEFKAYDWQKVYDNMFKPAFVFDGRNILDRKALENIGFKLQTIGK